jgi:hypothetical protein
MGFGSLKTAWLMCHKVRTALMQDIDKLGGIVEVDGNFVGGLAKNRHDVPGLAPDILYEAGARREIFSISDLGP